MERGDIVISSKNHPGKLKLLGIVIHPNPIPDKPGVGVNWIPCPPEEDYLRLHPTYDRYVDNPDWLEVIGHIDLDAA